MELHNSFFVKAYFDMTSNSALDVVSNAKSTIKYFEKLHEILEKCDSYDWNGEDSQWIHVYANTDDKKLKNILIEKYYFQEESEV
jgi:hypothetical protein